jgi:hypothetical protein
MVLLLWLLPYVLLASARSEPACTQQDWFAHNVYSLFVQPLVDRTTFVMAPLSSSMSPLHCHVGGETCEALGVANGLDVLAVVVRITLGWRMPSWIAGDHCQFVACPVLSTVSSVSADNRHACRLATRTLHCAYERWHWALAWILLLLALAGGLITYLALNICVLAARGNSSRH